MSKAVSFLALYISLFVVEILFVFIVLLVKDFIQYGIDIFYIRKAFFGTGLGGFWRVLFYGIPFILLYFLLFKYVGNIKLYKPLLFSLFNLFVYVGLSILTRVVWGKNVPLSMDVMIFYVTCLAIFLSPLILGQVPYFKKLMENL